MNEELAAIYTKEGISPFATILPVIIQLPIFVSLYKAITQLAKEDVHF
jgi:YidC/Oxa1 family membrane protein insertase